MYCIGTGVFVVAHIAGATMCCAPTDAHGAMAQVFLLLCDYCASAKSRTIRLMCACACVYWSYLFVPSSLCRCATDCGDFCRDCVLFRVSYMEYL